MAFQPKATCDITIDVSHWQGPKIDWTAVKNAGKLYVMIKATDGATGIDKTWQVHAAGARAAGLAIIPYHFSTPEDAAAQAQNFITTASLRRGMPAAIDWEIYQGAVAAAQQIDTIGNVLQAVIQRDPLAYWGTNPPGQPTAAAATWPRWIPRFGANTGYVDPNHEVTVPWLFWQYTSKATVPGIIGDVDASLFAGTADELKGWFNTGKLPASLSAGA